MSFNEIVDTLNLQGHKFSFKRMPKEVFASLGAYFKREADSPKLLKTLKTQSKGGTFWKGRRRLQNRCSGFTRVFSLVDRIVRRVTVHSGPE